MRPRRSTAPTQCRSCIHVTLPMMRNIISITMLFSLIVTFANFDIVRILTNGGPQDQTHLFATYAFQVGIQSGDIPLGASVSLFMLPLLALFAYLHPARRQQADQGGDVAWPAPAPTAAAAAHAAARSRGSSLRAAAPLGAVRQLCRTARLRVLLPVPPLYMLITSLKTCAEISALNGNPWLVQNPTLENFWELITAGQLPAASS